MIDKIPEFKYRLIKNSFSRATSSSILKVLSSLISQTQSSNPPPPFGDSIPFYYYRTPLEDKTRNLLHCVLSTWPCGSDAQIELLRLLKPLHDEYLLNHLNPELDSYGKFPSSGACSRYTFNIYPVDGYLDFHVDNISAYHTHQILAVLNKPWDHRLNISGSTIMSSLDKKQEYGAGDTLIFDPRKKHAVLPCHRVESSVREATLDPRHCHVDCSYVNLDTIQVMELHKRQLNLDPN